MRTYLRIFFITITVASSTSLLIPAPASAQRQADIDAINRLIDRYGALEDSMDMRAQAQLMSADRVWIGIGAGRRTDQAMNMRIQQAAFDQLRKRIPGIQTFTDDRDRLIKLYGNGSVAVASFYRHTATVLPAAAPPDIVEQFSPLPPVAFTLMLEKRDGDWKIVHTHVSSLAPPPGN